MMIETLVTNATPTGTTRPAEWLDRLMVRIRSFAQLEENWDSYGAPPIDQSSIRNAGEFARQCAVSLTPRTEPDVQPTASGYVEFSWESENQSVVLNVELLPNGTVHYLYENDETAETIEQISHWARVIDFLPDQNPDWPG